MPLVALAGFLISMGRIVRGVMKHIFPEINFDRLKAEVLGWARQFPFIRRVNFYQHRGGKFNTDKRYLIDIVVHNETPRKEIAYLETETEDIGGSSFFEGLMHAKSGEGFDRNNWEIYVRQQLDGPPIFTVGENSVLFDRPENLDFPRLNIDVLKNIANRWVKKYKNQHSIDIFSVRLFHYASDWQAEVARSMGINNGIIRVKYAIVLSVDKQNEEDMATDTKFYCTTSEIPTSFIYGNFEDVYSASVPKNWMREWAFIQHTCQAPLPNQVRVDEGCVVLYPQITQEERQHSKHTEKNDPQAWTFRCIGAQWQITFEGQTYSIKNNKSISYILPLIKQPGVPFGYVELCQIVEVVNIEDAPKKEKKKKEAGDLSQDGPVYEGGLREQASIKRYKEEEIKK